MSQPWLEQRGSDVFVKLFVKPNAKREAVIIDDEWLVFTLQTPPTKGKANKAVLKLFSKILNISTSRIHIQSGLKSQDKIILLQGISPSSFMEKLTKFLQVQKKQ